jgi:Tol biopolymer transport system component
MEPESTSIDLPETSTEMANLRIAFVSVVADFKQIFSVMGDGSDLTQLTLEENHNTHPTWSHDGKAIAFLRAEEEATRRPIRSHIYLMDSDGGNLRNLTPSTELELSSIAWSPGDQLIAYDGGRLDGDATFNSSNIFHLDVRTQEITQITQVSPNNLGCRDPSWSPDGSHLVFTCRALMNAGLEVVSVDGQDGFIVDFLGQVDGVSWLPSGETIAYTGGFCALGTLDAEYMVQQGGIEFVSYPCMEEELLSLDYVDEPIFAVEWSTTEDYRFVVQSDVLLQVIDLGKGEIIRVEADFSDVAGQISWGTGGEHVAYVFHDGTDYEISCVHLRTGEVTQITDNETDDLMPAWQP